MNAVSQRSPEPKTLERRIRSLQRQVTALGCAVVVLLCLGLLQPPRAHDTVAARRFVVLDGNGDTRAVLGMHVDRDWVDLVSNVFDEAVRHEEVPVDREYVALRLTDAEGSASLSVFEGEALLRLQQDEGEEVAELTAEELTIEEESEWFSRHLVVNPGGVTLRWAEEDDDTGEERGAEFLLDMEEGLSFWAGHEAPGQDDVETSFTVLFDDGFEDSPRLVIRDSRREAALFETPAGP